MFSEKIHRYIFLFGLISLAFGIMMGTVPTSVPQIILMSNWVLEGQFAKKWRLLKGNVLFWVLSSVFLVHVLGLLHTQNLQAGWDDVRTKIPLMFLPLLFFSTHPLSKNEYCRLLYFFIAGCFANTLWCLFYSFVWHQNEVMRNASRFMSHIRLGLYLNIAISCCVYFAINSEKVIKKVFWFASGFYFFFTLYALGLITGMVDFVILALLFLCLIIYRQKSTIRLASLLILSALIFSAVFYVLKIKNDQLKVKTTENNSITSQSKFGKPYIHFDTLGQKENGNYVLINIQLEELQREWKRIYPTDSFNYTQEHNLKRYEGLVRYLASKGLNKDSAGIAALSKEDLENIKNNVYNYQYPGWSFLHRRIYELVNDYDEFINKRQVNGHSFTMRLYFWQAGMDVAKNNFLCGVGSGDVQEAMNKAYINSGSPLHEEWFKRPHNQFLTITIAIGVFGLAIFLLSLIYPILKYHKFLPKLYWPFFIIVILSFMVEDTLETQAGLSFFAFFNGLFLSAAYYRSTIKPSMAEDTKIS